MQIEFVKGIAHDFKLFIHENELIIILNCENMNQSINTQRTGSFFDGLVSFDVNIFKG